MKAKDQNCAICGKGPVKLRRISRSYGRGSRLLVIENVPALTCSHCGESYMTAETLHEIERIKLHRKTVAKPQSVRVASFE
jgi:YgiT-type zinc finger domain-containing protein